MERYKWSFVSTLIGGMFFLFGIGFLIAPVISIVSWEEFKKEAVPVTAQIKDIDTYTVRRSGSNKRRTNHDVIIEYEYDGNSYTNNLGYYTSGMNVGDIVEILIDPDYPAKSKSDPYLFSTIMGAFCVCF